jgi:hypothetical protein
MIGSLADAEYDFRHAVANCAVVIHLCESDVLERHMPQPPERIVDADGAGLDLFEKLLKVVVIHSISSRSRSSFSKL